MLVLRRVATVIVIAASLAVVLLSVYLLWNARQNDYLPLHPSYTPDLRVQQLEEKLEIYSRRVNDMENVMIILLGISGLYIIVFILTADVNARSMRRRVDQAFENVRRQMDDSMRALRELKEETSNTIRAETQDAADRLKEVQQRAFETIQNMGAQIRNTMPGSSHAAPDLQAIQDRIATLADGAGSDEQMQEIAHYESALPALEVLHAGQFRPQLARIYRTLARYYEPRDSARSRFYLGHVQTMTPEDFETANELANEALQRQAPDYRQARKFFQASLAAQPDQQCAKYGLARIAIVEGDSETAIGLLESAVESPNWETSPDAERAALVHYTLACTLARRAQSATPAEQPQYLVRATEELKAAFTHPSRQLDEMLSRDTEEGGDLVVLANMPPYESAIDELLLNVCVGAA